MPDWTAPFHLPTLTTEKFTKMRHDYIEKHGYTITIPGLSDIIKIPIYDPMTEEEETLWKRRRYDLIPPARREEITKIKEAKKRRFMGMLGSPIPTVVRNAGSILTSVDDAQDALSTIGVIGMLGRRIAPRAVGGLLTGPTGMILAAADILNMVQQISMTCQAPLMGKNAARANARASTTKNKGRVSSAVRLSKHLPGKGDVIQALQTSEQIWGLGICLGPVLGLVQDIAFGTALSLVGKKVNVDLPVPDLTYWFRAALKVAKSASVLWGYPHSTDHELNLHSIAAIQLCYQLLMTEINQWHPLEHVLDISDIQIQAPIPTDILTREVIEESGKRLVDVCGWPQTDTLWAPLQPLMYETEQIVRENHMRHLTANKNNWLGYASGIIAVDSAQYFLAALEGEPLVEEDMAPSLKIAMNMLHHKTTLAPINDPSKFQLFADWMQRHDDDNTQPTIREIQDFCAGSAGIALLQR